MRTETRKYVYGYKNGNFFSAMSYDTAEKAEDACIDSMASTIMNGYDITQDYAIFGITFIKEFDDDGTLLEDTNIRTFDQIIPVFYVAKIDWDDEIDKRIEEINNDPSTDMYDINQLKKQIASLHERNYIDIEMEQMLKAKADEITIRHLIKGQFLEGENVMVNINGDIVNRKVSWSSQAGDLYVTKDGKKYFKSEF